MKFYTTLSTLLFIAHTGAWAGPSFTYEAQLIKPDGTPVTGTNTQIKIQIRTPDANSCLLYEEQQVKNLSTTNGYFNFNINDGSGNRLDTSSYSFDQVFSNLISFSIPSAFCVSGSGTVVTTPSPQDGRTVKVIFKDETMASWEDFPTENIGHVPYSLQASAVGGFPASSLLRVENSGAPVTIAALTSQNFTDLQDLIDGTSTKYLTYNSNGAAIPSFSSNPASPSAGHFWYDSTNNVLKYYDGTATQTLSAGGGGSITSMNGLTSSAQTLSIGATGTAPSWSSSGNTHTLDIPLASSSAVTAGLISKAEYDSFNNKLTGALNSGNIYVGNASNIATPVSVSGDASLSNTGVLTLASTVALLTGRSGGQVFNGGDNFSDSLTLDSTSNATKGSVLINPYDGNVGVGLTVPNTKLDVAGAITSGPYGSSPGNTGQLILRELAANGANSITLRAPDSLPANTILTLPNNSGVNGQMLMTDGAGNTSWSNPGSPSTILASSGSAGSPSISFSSSSNTGLYSPAASMLGFSTGGSERLRIDSSGSIGIGTIAPIAPFHVMMGAATADAIFTAQTAAKAQILLTGPSGSAYPGAAMSYNVSTQDLEFTKVTSGSTSSNPWVRMNGATGIFNFTAITGGNVEAKMSLQRGNGLGATPTATALARISFDGHNGSGYSDSAAAIQGMSAQAFSGGANGAHLLFYTTPVGTVTTTERMRIDAAGNIGIGTATPNHKLDVFGDLNLNTSNALRIGGTSICTTSGCTAVSDAKLKRDIEPLTNSLEKVMQLQGVQYNWIDQNKFGSQHQVGLIAQELEKVYPEVVKMDAKTGLKSVAYDHLIAPLIEAIKEIFWRSEEQNRQIASIQEENEKLKRENMAIKSYLCAKDPTASICK